MAYLFDTNAISELARRRPNEEFAAWVRTLPRVEQYTSMVVVSELYTAAHRSAHRDRWIQLIDETVLGRMTLLRVDLEAARICGRLRAELLDRGEVIGENDVQIAAVALRHRLTVVTANAAHFGRFPDIDVRGFRPGRTG